MATSMVMDLEANVATLQGRIDRLLEQQKSDARGRILVALAGVPGSGKTTVSSALLASLSRNGKSRDDVVVVPMVCIWFGLVDWQLDVPFSVPFPPHPNVFR